MFTPHRRCALIYMYVVTMMRTCSITNQQNYKYFIMYRYNNNGNEQNGLPIQVVQFWGQVMMWRQLHLQLLSGILNIIRNTQIQCSIILVSKDDAGNTIIHPMTTLGKIYVIYHNKYSIWFS